MGFIATLLCSAAALVAAGDVQIGDNVYPAVGKVPLDLKADNQVVGQAKALSFLKVLQVNGDWMWVQVYDMKKMTNKEMATPLKGWALANDLTSVPDAISTYLNADVSEDKKAGIFLTVGLLAERANQDARAGISYFSRAIALNSTEPALYIFRSHAWAQLGNWGEVANDLQSASKLSPADESLKKAAESAAKLVQLKAQKQLSPAEQKKLSELEQSFAP